MNLGTEGFLFDPLIFNRRLEVPSSIHRKLAPIKTSCSSNMIHHGIGSIFIFMTSCSSIAWFFFLVQAQVTAASWHELGGPYGMVTYNC